MSATNPHDWIVGALEEIPPASFETRPHRRMPAVCRDAMHVTHVRVPLAMGSGTAVVTRPRGGAVQADRFALLLHGMGDDAAYPLWPWMRALAARGVVSLSVDWDGHGAGGSSLFALPHAVRSVERIVRALYAPHLARGSDAPPQCLTVGFSTGAALALAALARPGLAREVTRAAVVVSPAVAVASDISAALELLSYASPRVWREELLPLVPYYGYRGLIPAFWKVRRAQFPIRLAFETSYSGQVRAFARETFEERRALRDVTTPVYWVHGRADHIVPFAKAARIMNDLPNVTALHTHRTHLRTGFSLETADAVADHVAGLDHDGGRARATSNVWRAAREHPPHADLGKRAHVAAGA